MIVGTNNINSSWISQSTRGGWYCILCLLFRSAFSASCFLCATSIQNGNSPSHVTTAEIAGRSVLCVIANQFGSFCDRQSIIPINQSMVRLASFATIGAYTIMLYRVQSDPAPLRHGMVPFCWELSRHFWWPLLENDLMSQVVRLKLMRVIPLFLN